MSSTAAIQPRARARPARGNERRLALLDATLEVIGAEGVDAVTHRRVADVAGVPLGSTTYWFSSRQAMLTEALEHFARADIANARERFRRVLAGRPSRRRLVDEFVAYLMPQLGPGRANTIAQYALLEQASREPELEPVVRDWTEAWQAALAEVFTELGARRPELEARMFLAMLDGLSLVQLAAPDDDFETKVLRPALDTWFARLGGGA
jgi:TetR/AcrR family transcriptional regulator, regulator of biofilm formation and stress response